MTTPILGVFRTTDGTITPGPRLRALRAHRGDYILTRRDTHGFIEFQGVRIVDAADAGFRGLEVYVEGIKPGTDGQETIRAHISIDDLCVPNAWFEAA